MAIFQKFVGIDYSGQGTARTRTAGLQVYAATAKSLPDRVNPSATGNSRIRNWCRQEIAEWLITQATSGERFIAGLDFSFSLPLTYLQRYGLRSWDAFLLDFIEHWPTDQSGVTVDQLRPDNPRTGSPDELRVTERWTSSAKSNFLFDVQGQVAKSTHAGIPWLHRIRQAVGKKVHFWPYDGWEIRDKQSVIVEAYPSILRRRYPTEGRSADQHDAYVVARWLSEMGNTLMLDRYFNPPLTRKQQAIAELEGWILGVM